MKPVIDATCRDSWITVEKNLSPLIGQFIDYLSLPKKSIVDFEPSQFGTIVGTLVDAMLPEICHQMGIGLHKSSGIIGEREGYPDFEHVLGYRLELKGLFKDNPSLNLKRPPTPREPSARLTQKVTLKNVIPSKDLMLLICYQMEERTDDNNLISPRIKDLKVFPVIELVKARDFRMESQGGKWFGNYETPTILSKSGRQKKKGGLPLDETAYGRKESEGKDYNEDTNFGKLKRIPYQRLHEFLKKHNCSFASQGNYPSKWSL